MYAIVEDGVLLNELLGTIRPINSTEVSLLQRLWTSPEMIGSIAPDPLGDTRLILNKLWEEGILVADDEDESAAFSIARVDIETCRSCNARCRYCPQSVAPKPRGVMSEELYYSVLEKLSGLSPEWVALNHYGEPLLDPMFASRIVGLSRQGFALRLFTNGILLGAEKLATLARTQVQGIVFNYPAMEPKRWSELMGVSARLHGPATTNIERVVANQLAPVEIAVNGMSADRRERLEKIRDHFASVGSVRVLPNDSNSRAGAIEGDLVCSATTGDSEYAGCSRAVRHLHVSWKGQVYLCCQDYAQEYVLGDLTEESIAEILNGKRAQTLRKAIFGISKTPENLICGACTRLRRRRFSESCRGTE